MPVLCFYTFKQGDPSKIFLFYFLKIFWHKIKQKDHSKYLLLKDQDFAHFTYTTRNQDEQLIYQ